MHVLETSALIDVLKSTSRGKKIISLIGTDEVIITAITAHETLAGDPLLSPLLDTFEIIPFDKEVAQISAELERKQKAKGRILQVRDLLIAATCIAHKHTLVSTDTGFRHAESLNLLLVE